MLKYLKNKILGLKSNSRGGIVRKNILFSFIIKGGNILINIMYVPLLINTLGKTEYGIWLVLTSVLGWFAFFDIGLGNGFRNKFAEAKAAGNNSLARSYLSTTYAILIVVFFTIGIVFVSLIPVIDWNSIFNTYEITEYELVRIIYIVFVFFILRFITQLISVLLLADQRTALSSSMNLGSNLIILILILLLNKINYATLLICSIILSGVPVMVYIIASIYFYKKDYNAYKPSIKFVNFKYSNELFNLGIKFFIIQISGIIFYSSTNILIAQFFSPEEVTIYNIGYKYFSVINMFFGIILSPMWTAITDAYVKCEFEWIKRTMKKLKYIAFIFSIIVLIMLIFADTIYSFWIGNEILIPFELSFVLALGTLIFLFFSPYTSFLNGVSKIKLNMVLVTVQMLFYFPVSYFMAIILDLKLPGIIIAGFICELPLRVYQPIQYRKIINKNAYGIWNE